MKRFLPLALIMLAIALVFVFDLHKWLSLDALKTNRQWLLDQVHNRPLVTGAAFTIIYAIAVAISIPGALVLTLAGGFLFGTWLGGLLVVIGATIGAICIFLVAKTALGSSLKRKAGPWLGKMESGFKEDGISYLLILRLVPIFPFWLVNLVPAFMGVGIGMFALTTFFGIMPGSFVYASVGNGLGEVFALGEEPDLSLITQPAILGPILALAALACIPIIYKKFKAQP